MKRTLWSGACVFVLAVGVLGCSDDDEEEPAATEHEGEDPLYLAVARVWDDTTTTSYLHVVPSLEADVEIDVEQARELPGPAKLFSAGDDRWFAIGDGEAPTITRYTLDERGRLEEGDRISLQPYGVSDLWDALYFVSRDKAYYPDTENSQLIVWNPETMEVTGALELPETAREGFTSYYSMTTVRRGALLLFTVGWFDWETDDTVLPELGLVAIDTETDELVSFEIDERCAGATQLLETASGDAYAVSSALAGAAYQLGRIDVKPCALRVRADDDDRFDPEYHRELSSLTGSEVAGEPAPFEGDELLLRVFDEAAAEVVEDGQTWDLTGQSVWTWSRWNVETDAVEALDGLPPSTADAFWFRVDGQVYASQTTEDYSETTLIDLTGGAAPEPALVTPGFLQNVARIR